jgi:hypothetical protein
VSVGHVRRAHAAPRTNARCAEIRAVRAGQEMAARWDDGHDRERATTRMMARTARVSPSVMRRMDMLSMLRLSHFMRTGQ